MLPEEIRSFCESKYGRVDSFRPASGGCINNGGQLDTEKGVFFVKWNSSGRYPKMFDKEQMGLELLAQAKAMTIPGVVDVYNGPELSCIVMDYIKSAPPKSHYWQEFGRRLARIHQVSAPQYGLDHHNYMGSLEQVNTPRDSWIDFFTENRLQAQLKLATDHNRVDHSHVQKFDILYKRLPDLLVVEKPSLIHGDLWSGNIMVDESGLPAIIDPAVSLAHREMDIGMTQLFGRLPGVFYEAYNEVFPMTSGWPERCDIYNIYPLLVHVNLFGGGYLGQTMQIVNKYL